MSATYPITAMPLHPRLNISRSRVANWVQDALGVSSNLDLLSPESKLFDFLILVA